MRVLARLLMALSLVPAASCLSVRWEDGEGNTHHMGSFYYEVDQLEHGTRLHRVSVGADLRLSGQDRGLTLGIKRIDEVTPELVEISDPEHLAPCVAAYLAGGDPQHLDDVGGRAGHANPELERLARLPADASTRQWGFFYYKEPRGLRPTVVRTQSLGADLKRGPVGGGLDFGYSARFRVVGRALDADMVQIHSFETEGAPNERLMLWSLDPGERMDVKDIQ